MSATSSLSNSGLYSTTDSYTSTASRIPQKNLGQSDFLKLLTVQLSKQDPMKPMDDTSFIAQMAQFTTLQQSSEMLKSINSVAASSDFATASALLGRSVTVTDSKSATGSTTGTVTGVDATSGTPQIVIDGKPYSLSSLQRVTEAVQPAA